MTISSFSPVESSPFFAQNPNYFAGSEVGAGALSTGNVISASDLLDEHYLDMRDNYEQARDSYSQANEGRDAAINSKITNIVSYIENGKEDRALETYNQLLDEMSKQKRFANLRTEEDDTQLRALAKQLIETKSEKNLEEIIRENTRNQASVDSQKIRTWGNCDSVSQEELLAQLCDIHESSGHSNIISDVLNVIVSPFVVVGNTLFNGGKKM